MRSADGAGALTGLPASSARVGGGHPAGERAGLPRVAHGVSCDGWGRVFRVRTPGSGGNTPRKRSLAHLVEPGLGSPYI